MFAWKCLCQESRYFSLQWTFKDQTKNYTRRKWMQASQDQINVMILYELRRIHICGHSPEKVCEWFSNINNSIPWRLQVHPSSVFLPCQFCSSSLPLRQALLSFIHVLYLLLYLLLSCSGSWRDWKLSSLYWEVGFALDGPLVHQRPMEKQLCRLTLTSAVDLERNKTAFSPGQERWSMCKDLGVSFRKEVQQTESKKQTKKN